MNHNARCSLHLFATNIWRFSMLLLLACGLLACGGKTAPDVWYVAPICTQPNKVWVQFAEGSDKDPLNATSAQTAANYSVAGTTVTASRLYTDEQAVVLTLSSNLAVAASVNVTASNVKDAANRTQSPASVTLPVLYHSTVPGAVAQYYSNRSLTGSPTKTIVDSKIDFDVGSGSVSSVATNNVSARWYTFVELSQTGTYDLRTVADDGVRVWFGDIAGDKVIDAWYDTTWFTGDTNYASDTYDATSADLGTRRPIVMEYYENSGNAYAHLQWDTPSAGGYATIPAAKLFTCVAAPVADEVGSYTIVAPATASTCSNASISITAKDTVGATLSAYAGTVNLSTTSGHGDWALSTGAGTLANGTADDGVASYAFAAGDSGTVTLTLTDVHADTLKITAAEAGGTVSSQSTAIAFSDNAFIVSTNDSFGADVIAGRNHGVVVQFVRRPPNNPTQCALDTGYTGSKNLKVWRTRTAADPGGSTPSLAAGASVTTLPAALPGTNNLTGVSFSAGQATLALATTDIGQYALNVRDDSSGYVVDASGAAIAVNGSSTNLTVRPFGLNVSAQSTAGLANPKTATATGQTFVTAGTPFNVTVSAVRYEAADDTNPTDGIPDGHNDAAATTIASLSNNLLTGSFGLEQNGLSASASLSASLKFPVGGNSPALAGTVSVASFSSGTGTVQSRFDDLGTIEISAATANYLGSGRALYGKSGYVGRFFPAWFAVSETLVPSLAHGHGTCSYTYQGESVGYAVSPMLTITAKNAQAATTNNYGNSYWKFTAPLPASLSANITNLPAGSTTTLTRNTTASVNTLAGTSDFDGTGTLTFSGDTYTFNKSGSGPTAGDSVFSPKLTLTIPADELRDVDGACYQVAGSGPCASFVINALDDTGFTGTELRYARLKLTNVHGSNLAPALMPAQVEHWATVGSNQIYVPSTEENNGCSGTVLNVSAIALDNYQGNLVAGNITPSFGGISAGGGGIINLALDAGAATSTISGMARVTVTVPVSLQYNQTGSGLANPTATATFGIYNGRDPIFNVQETFR